MKSWKRVLSLLLVLLMCLSLLPASALAEGEEELVAAEAEQEVLLPAPEEPAAEEAVPAEPETAAEAEVPTEAEAAPAAEEAVPVEETAPAEAVAAPEAPAAEATEAAAAEEEVEEGVFHGQDRHAVLPMGVYNKDFPVIESFAILENGQTLSAGDTVTFAVKASDKDGIKSANLYFGNNYGSYWQGEYINLTLNAETGLWEGSYTFKDADIPSEYYVTYLQVTDSYSFYTSYHSNARRVMQRLLPGFVFLGGEGSPDQPAANLPKNFVFEEKDQTLEPGDVLHISFDLEPGLEYVSVNSWVSGNSGFSMGSYGDEPSFRYDAETGHVTGTYTLTDDMVNGIYYISYISAYYYADGEDVNLDWDFDYRSQSFTLTGGAEVVAAAMSISDIRCLENGQTLTDGDTVHFTFQVNGAVPTSASMSISLFQAWDSSYGSGVSTGVNGSQSCQVTVNESGLCEAEYTFQETDVYGVYQVSSVSARGDKASAYVYDSDVLFLFAESKDTSFTRLDKATNLSWTSDGYARFKMPANHQGKVNISFYREDGQHVNGCTYTSLGADTSWTEKNGVDQFLESDELADGRYYFTVTVLGDGKTYYDSETVKSGYFTYKAPAAKLGFASNLGWTDEGGETKVGSFTLPNDKNLGGYQYEWYYSETENATPVACGYTGRGDAGSENTGRAWLFDNLLQIYGAGCYYYKVRLLSSNILKCRNGDWSEMSPAYKVSVVAGSTTDRLNEVETEGKTPAEIKEQVQEIPTDALLTAMLSDDSAVDALRKLEAKAGAQTQVEVSIPELSGTTAVGAGLNDTVNDGNVTLLVGEPEWDDVLPAMYDNTVALRFSMDLDNVEDTENLKVPVLVDLPIPENINPAFLVVLHYHVAGGAPEQIWPYTYQAGNRWYAQFALTSFSDFVLTQRMGAPKQFVANTYLMLTVGDTVAPELFEAGSEDSDGMFIGVQEAFWFVTDENGELYASDDDAVISVDEDGNVTALKVGTAYVAADLVRVVGYDYYSGEPLYGNETVRCRVDVIPAENEEGEELVNPVDAEVTRLTLRDTKATTELYSTNYTKITVLAETKRLAGAAAIREEDEIEVPKDQGVAIESAWFTGVGAELFELKVVDDRTLAIVPTYDAMELAQAKAANVKKSYTFGIEVVLSDGTSKIVEAVNGKPAALALTVKQTMPALKASALKFNSLVPWDWHSFGFTGNVVTALEPDYAAAAKAKKEAIPAWLGYGPDGANLMENAPAKASGKLYLLATLDGWAVKKPITVSYSVAATAPTMTLKPATVTLRADQSTSYWTDVTVKPGAFAGPSDFHFEFVIKEKVNKQDVVYENGTVLQVDYSFYSITEKQANGYFDVFLGPDYVDGNHTYTVQARIYNNSGTPFGAAKSFTVKTVAEDRTLKISSRGSIEALAQPGSGGYIYLPASFKCYQLKGNETLSTEIRYVASGSKTEVPVKINVFQNGEFPEDYSGAALFNVYPNQWGVNINLNWHEEPQVKKGTYYAYTTAHFADGTTSKTVKTKLNIKWTDPAKIKLVTVKVNNATGTIDPVRYGSGVTFLLKASNGNFYDRPTAENGAEEPGYVITETIGKSKRELSEAENPFEVYDTYLIVKNTYYPFAVRVSLRDGAVLNPKASYSIKFDFRNYVGIESYSADYKLPIKMAAVKLETVSAVKLLLSDRYSNGEFVITPKDASVKPVKTVALDAASAKLFELHEVGNGRWAIGFKGNKIPAGLKLGGSKTVKLSITFEGNETGKANTTVSLKVNLK